MLEKSQKPIVFLATVKSTKDPLGLGRVQVSLKSLEKAVEMPWIRMIHSHASKGFGTVVLPEVGDMVAVLRGAGDRIGSMYILGSVYDKTNKPAIKDKDGKKHQGSWSDGGNTDAESDPKGKGNAQKKTADYPGKKIEDVPADQRCCIHYCWVKKDGTSFCYKFNKGIECHAPHLIKPTKAMMETKVYNRLKDQHGPPNCPAGGPKAPEKK